MTVLVAIDMVASSLDRLRAAYTVRQATTHDARMALAAEHGDDIRAIVTNGRTIIPAALIGALPRLGIICAMGVGYEGVDLPAARARGIAVTNGAGANATCVADHAMALLLAVMRGTLAADAFVRGGGWQHGFPMQPMPSGKRVGILGLGDIGARVARRCAGFDMQVGYHNRRPAPGCDYPYFDSPLSLAAWAEVLMVVLPGGTATRHLVGAAELDALGPGGVLVNVGRGTVVDTAALVDALRHGRLHGAGLDVVEGEPVLPADLLALRNVVLTPHMAGRAPETVAVTIDLALTNLARHFAGEPLVTPV